MTTVSAPHDILDQVEIRPRVDYITITTPGKVDLPELGGRPHWSKKYNYQRLSIHDLHPGDIPALQKVLPEALVMKIEVAIDFVPIASVTDIAERTRIRQQVHAWLVKHLHPLDAPFMEGVELMTFDPVGWLIRPFNFRAPLGREEVLYGHRSRPVQVKIYTKLVDNKNNLDESRCCVRAETTLGTEACRHYGLYTLGDLHTFKFRKVLSPYFRLTSGARIRRRRSRRPILQVVNERIQQVRQRWANEAWIQNGVRAVDDFSDRTLSRLVQPNQRIGKALSRLQSRFAC
ncbi:MAG: hypothetical protein WDZ63_07405 [Burkholderiales bacterium]